MILSKKQVAEKYKVTERTISRWMKNQHLPYHKSKFNGRVLFKSEELEKWEKEVDFGKIG